MKRFTSPTQKTGELGEDVASRYLEREGYRVVDRNVTASIGELDLVVTMGDKWYGVEVKSVAVRGHVEPYPVWQNITYQKKTKLRKMLHLYAKQSGRDVMSAGLLGVFVQLRMDTRRARVEVVEILH
jgi:Holliday junction resolvase-like predicted endonuclease